MGGTVVVEVEDDISGTVEVEAEAENGTVEVEVEDDISGTVEVEAEMDDMDGGNVNVWV